MKTTLHKDSIEVRTSYDDELQPYKTLMKNRSGRNYTDKITGFRKNMKMEKYELLSNFGKMRHYEY